MEFSLFLDNEHHGKGGEYKIDSPRYYNKMHDVFFNACKEIGLNKNEDFNDWSHS